LVLNNVVMRFFGVKQCLNVIFYLYDVKMRHLENRFSYLGSLLILNFLILNGEILTKMIEDISTPEKKFCFLYLRS
jgi:hypothetical protein